MAYYIIEIEVSENGIEILTGKLLSVGIENTIVSDPRDALDIMEKKESYEWDYVEKSVIDDLKQEPKVTVVTEEKSDIEVIEKGINSLKKDIEEGIFGELPKGFFGSLNYTVSEETDYSWQTKWKETFKPFEVAEGIVIKPSWEELPGNFENAKVVIEIDPGMAFGTGSHETTSLCIKMLSKYLRENDKVLDAGCGSGILSIVAAKLGAKEVLGVDIDLVAVAVAKENLECNHVEKIADAKYGDVTKGVDFKGNIVVANLMAELIAMITPDILPHIYEDGYYITSGILVEKEDMVSKALTESGFEIVEIEEKGEWCCIVATPKGKDI